MRTRGKKVDAIDDYHKLEIEEIFTSMREQGNRRTQIFSFLGTAHLVTLGLAFNNQRVSILILAIIFPIALIIIDRSLKRSRVAAELRGLELESMYAPDSEFAFLHILIGASRSSSKHIEELRAINKIKEPDRRIILLRRIRPGLTPYIAVLLLIIIEIGVAISLYFSGWSIF